VVTPKLKDLTRPAIKRSIDPEKHRETFNQQQKYRSLHILCRALLLFGIFATSAFLIYLSRPWEDIFSPESASGYWGVLCLLLWAIAPYFPLLVMARRSHAGLTVNLLRLIGAAIICAGGAVIYLDAFLHHPEPLGVLVFLAVPVYQWMAVAPLMLMDYCLKRRNREGIP
jgi:hypothetical protein